MSNHHKSHCSLLKNVTSTNNLNNLSLKVLNINTSLITSDTVNELQSINDEISLLMKCYGTDKFEDLLSICYSSVFTIENLVNKNT